MKSFVEFIGGPRCGEVQAWHEEQLPRIIHIMGSPDHAHALTRREELTPASFAPPRQGTYSFTKLHQALWKDAQWGDYEWQGWE